MQHPHRSLLFVPGHRESMLTKAATLATDAIIFDLEDSVPLSEKEIARQRVVERLAHWPADGPTPFVRIRPPGDGGLAEDVRVLLTHPSAGAIVPKVDLPSDLDELFALTGRERDVIVNVETPRSLLHAEAFADLDGVAGLFLGGEDFTNALGTQRTPAGTELSWPRYLVLVAARAAGIAAYDTVCPEFRDLDVLTHDCQVAAAMGFDGKFAIHPAQLPVIHGAFTPSADDVERARRIVEAFDAAVARGEGAVAVDGQMVDPPVAERARGVLARAERSN